MMNTGKQATIVVSGCTKGIGRAIVELFAADGFNVAGCARSTEELSAMQKNFSSLYPEQTFRFSPCDMSRRDDVKGFAEKVSVTFGHADVLVNNAGTFIPGKVVDEEDGVLEKLIETNVYSAYHLTRALLPGMSAQKSGHVFNICSVASLRAYPNGGSYAISKFAMLGFSRQLREELKGSGIRVTALMPGATLTDSWSGAGLPESRFIAAADIAKTIAGVYRLSPQADVEEMIIRPQQGDIL